MIDERFPSRGPMAGGTPGAIEPRGEPEPTEATEPAEPAEPPIEIELKYDVADPAAFAALEARAEIGPFAVGPELATVLTEDRFVDTRDRRLRAAGYVARLRRTDGATAVTLKSVTTRSGAEHRRQEVEAPATDALDPASWPPSAPRSIVLELVGDRRLVELAAVRQRRRPHELVAGETLVELTADEVAVVVDGSVVDEFLVLEAELKRGDELLLGELADALDAVPGLAPAAGSKMARALRATDAHRAAAAGQPAEGGTASSGESEGKSPADRPAPPPPRFPGVTADDTVAEAGRKVLRFHLDRLVAREAGTRLGEDPEELHSMRVATRRLRAAWRVFEVGFRPDRTRRLRRRLRLVADRLGAVRDRDVLIEGLERYAGELAPAERAGLEPLVEELRQERFEARLALIRELDSEEYRSWLEAFLDFARREGAGAAPVVPTLPHHVRDTAASALWGAYERVRAYEAILRSADVATLHELRIAAKRFRYTIEYLRETLSPEAGALIARLVVLQDHLGELNDAVVAGSFARSYLVRNANALDEVSALAIGRYLTGREREVERLRATLGPAWRGVASPSFRRLLGRVTAAL